MKSMYIHIPFCKKICSYCDFCKVIYHGPWVKKYIYALEQEIEERYNNEEMETIYIGGGTPSSLTNTDLRLLLDFIKEKIHISNNLEYTFECNLNDIDELLLNTLKEYGINRLSIGIESFNEKKLQFMDRYHTFDEALEKIELARTLGFDNINIDLI